MCSDVIKKRDEKFLRDSFRDWVRPTCNQIWTDERIAKRIYVRDGRRKILPKQKFIDFYNLIKDLDADSCSIVLLKKIFKKVDKLEFIELSEHVADIIPP